MKKVLPFTLILLLSTVTLSNAFFDGPVDKAKDFMEAGKKRLAGDMTRQATSSEVTGLKRETRNLKEVVAEQTLELRLLKKSMLGDGGDPE